ncbi:MAG: T9SS type A sorting domain-containing protein [Bacteroidetes bacterium]|nr:T9SS type A sorting domain-containing protein [Bacteroidota bacterium]
MLKISFTLGVPDNIVAIPFDILPNPAKNELLIDTKGQIIEELYIYSSKGNLVILIAEAGISPTIDVLQLSSGLYFIRFVVQGKTITKKFVKY